jgi:acylphosphatase
LIAYQIMVSGRVQRVGYRASVYQIATRMGIMGYVRNMNDGRVEILAQSWEDEKLELFVDSLKSVGWPARVDDISKTKVDFSEDVRNFRIVR